MEINSFSVIWAINKDLHARDAENHKTAQVVYPVSGVRYQPTNILIRWRRVILGVNV
jgi:hypothetical protein